MGTEVGYLPLVRVEYHRARHNFGSRSGTVGVLPMLEGGFRI